MKIKFGFKLGEKQFEFEFTLDRVFIFAMVSSLSNLLIR